MAARDLKIPGLGLGFVCGTDGNLVLDNDLINRSPFVQVDLGMFASCCEGRSNCFFFRVFI
jgi:hypothetical protein